MFDDTYQNTVELGSVAVFDNVERGKAQAMKVLEEAAEVFGAWQKLDKDTFSDSSDLIAELCDMIHLSSSDTRPTNSNRQAHIEPTSTIQVMTFCARATIRHPPSPCTSSPDACTS